MGMLTAGKNPPQHVSEYSYLSWICLERGIRCLDDRRHSYLIPEQPGPEYSFQLTTCQGPFQDWHRMDLSEVPDNTRLIVASKAFVTLDGLFGKPSNELKSLEIAELNFVEKVFAVWHPKGWPVATLPNPAASMAPTVKWASGNSGYSGHCQFAELFDGDIHDTQRRS